MTNPNTLRIEISSTTPNNLIEIKKKPSSLLSASTSHSHTLNPPKEKKENSIPYENCTNLLDKKKCSRVPRSVHQDENDSNILRKKRKRRKNCYNFNKKSTSKTNPVLQSIENYRKKVCLLYSKEEYQCDITTLKRKSTHQFMMENFPSMYTQVNLYTYYKNLIKRRKEHREIFIPNSTIVNSFYLKQSFPYEVKIPKKLWSVPENSIDYNDFFNKCIQKWPFEQCIFVKEFALEFLMLNNYKINFCFDNMEQFVQFTQAKIKEHNIPPLRTDAKIIKNYSLRAQKKP